jgi:hemerythrin-like domain-containing protein
MRSAIAVIRDEHRSLAAVLHGLGHLIEEIGHGRLKPDHSLIRAMLLYIDRFPERLHHPKEDEFLYRALRRRDPSAAGLLDRLEDEHAKGRPMVAALLAAAEHYAAGEPGAFTAFVRAVDDYCRFQWTHMKSEEEEALPLAERTLTPEDWQGIDAAFRANEDPIGGLDSGREYRELFRRIANLAPPPIGVGPET